jgi:hypothetical protein
VLQQSLLAISMANDERIETVFTHVGPAKGRTRAGAKQGPNKGRTRAKRTGLFFGQGFVIGRERETGEALAWPVLEPNSAQEDRAGAPRSHMSIGFGFRSADPSSMEMISTRGINDLMPVGTLADTLANSFALLALTGVADDME